MVETLKKEAYEAIKKAINFAKQIKDKNSKTAILNTEYQIGRYHAYILLLEKLDFDAFEEIHNENKEHWKMCTLAIEKLYE